MWDGKAQGRWGRMVESQWGSEKLPSGGWKVHGCLTPLPVVGQTVNLGDEQFRFVEVIPKNNPRDLFFGTIEPVDRAS